MTLGASDRCAQMGTQFQARNSEIMIAAIVDSHVGSFRHVAVDTGDIAALVPMVPGCIENSGLMALCANGASVGAAYQFARMRIVAIAAGNARSIHFALHEGTVYIDLVIDLAICKVQTFG